LQEETQQLFENVQVELITPVGDFFWTYPIGESLQTLILRLVSDHDLMEEGMKLYLEEISPMTFMMDPLSLNDFPRVRELAKGRQAIRIVVDAKSAAM